MKIRDTANCMFLMTLLICYFRLMPPRGPVPSKMWSCGLFRNHDFNETWIKIQTNYTNSETEF